MASRVYGINPCLPTNLPLDIFLFLLVSRLYAGLNVQKVEKGEGCKLGESKSC